MTISHITTMGADDGTDDVLVYYRSPDMQSFNPFENLDKWLTSVCEDPWSFDDQAMLSVQPDGEWGYMVVYRLSRRDAMMCRLVW